MLCTVFTTTFNALGTALGRSVEPHCFNDLKAAALLLDRAATARALAAAGVARPRTLVSESGADRSEDARTGAVTVAGQGTLERPFVEKPANGEDHNVWIYGADGSRRRLFRKTATSSSELDARPDGAAWWPVRREGPFVYEAAVKTPHDIKVYAIGDWEDEQRAPHVVARRRKAPTVDGRIERDANGVELAEDIELTPAELDTVRRVMRATRSLVCGLDMLRDEDGGPSIVCDVNGWSFVKNCEPYYPKCARTLARPFASSPAGARWQAAAPGRALAVWAD